MPRASWLARQTARRNGVFARDMIEECEQVAYKALLEAHLRYREACGPFEVYVWKWVVGAVKKLLRRELARGGTGLDDALEACGDVRDTTDPFDDEDDDVRASLKADGRRVTLARFLGDTRAALASTPEDTLVRARTWEALERALGGLDPEERQLLELRYVATSTWDEVAAAMRMNERRARRIEERLRERLLRDLCESGVEGPPSSDRT